MKTRPPKKIPTQARAKAKRDAILRGAERVLLEEGPAAVTTTSISKSAGVPVGSVYQYFEDKDDILFNLYDTAYNEVEERVKETLAETPKGQPFRETLENLNRTFWLAAREHPTFRALTRWANSQRSLWEVTPGLDSSLAALVINTLEVSGVKLPASRREPMLRTMVTTISILVDQAIEEDDEDKAEALILEIANLFSAYTG
ncbi:TetR/AcrR family transcriptional regulator [Kordiimonas aestuarii]|uniref:TetR/AcrR family transcriptional regulator n=1 Tax=Kordiimonas aestuarii TaxID=1005925 RepID=UPI0021D2CA03|nr:TetR/AcrR family transcriptional regulator [Kordiimonas aestuarii]